MLRFPPTPNGSSPKKNPAILGSAAQRQLTFPQVCPHPRKPCPLIGLSSISSAFWGPVAASPSTSAGTETKLAHADNLEGFWHWKRPVLLAHLLCYSSLQLSRWTLAQLCCRIALAGPFPAHAHAAGISNHLDASGEDERLEMQNA